MSRSATDTTSTLDREREAVLEVLAEQRHFLLHTLQGLDQEQATTRTTASELTLVGLVKHLTSVERGWMDFIERGEDLEADQASPEALEHHARTFRLVGEETLESVLADYERPRVRPRSTCAPCPTSIASTSSRRPLAGGRGVLERPQVLLHLDPRDLPALRARRHHPRDARRAENHGLKPLAETTFSGPGRPRRTRTGEGQA